MQQFMTYSQNAAVSLFKEGVEERCVDSGVKVDSHFPSPKLLSAASPLASGEIKRNIICYST